MPSGGGSNLSSHFRVVLGFVVLASCLNAQERFGAGPDRTLNIVPSDRAVLASDSNRTDLPCRVEPLDPSLDFELKFQAGYLIHLPMAELSTNGGHLRVLFRIRPLDDGEHEALYFTQHFNVPPIEEGSSGSATLPGRYVLGPGRYQIDWLMRDRAGRVCSSHWVTKAASLEKYEDLAAAATANTIAVDGRDMFGDEPPVMRNGAGRRLAHIRILLNLSPVDKIKPKLSEYDLGSLVSMMRALHREPSIGLFSVTAISANQENVVYDVSRSSRIDFEALGEAVEDVAAGMVDFSSLSDPESAGRFLAGVLNSALSTGEDRADAVIILGPKIDREERIPENLLDIDGKRPPTFRFAYNRNPRSYPWRGSIGNTLKSRGLVEYTIARPKDFGAALADLVMRLGGS